MVSQSKEIMNDKIVIGGQECPRHSALWETPSLEDGRVWGRRVWKGILSSGVGVCAAEHVMMSELCSA